MTQRGSGPEFATCTFLRDGRYNLAVSRDGRFCLVFARSPRPFPPAFQQCLLAMRQNFVFFLFVTSPQTVRGRAGLSLSLIWLLVSLAGCSPPDSIRRYEVAKTAPSDRMLAAIVPHGDQAWFFKVSGKDAALEPHSKAFVEMVRSLKFAADGQPSWTAPKDWREKADTGPRGPMSSRFATLEIAGEGGPYELTITPLRLPAEDLNSYVLANVNRWRGQLGLRPISDAQLPTKTTQFDLAGAQVTIVDLLGNLGGGPAMPMTPPFAGAAGGPAPSATGAGASLKFDAPEGWSQGELEVSRGGIQIRRQAAFEVKKDDQSVEITATRMPGDPSSLLINVNRWRGQIQLEPVTEAQLEADSEKIDLDGATGAYVQLIGAKDAILGVVAFRDGMAWFIKMQGDHDLAIQERTRFDEFLKSIRFE